MAAADDPKPAPPPPDPSAPKPAVPLWRSLADWAGLSPEVDAVSDAASRAGAWIRSQIPAASPAQQARYAAIKREMDVKQAALQQSHQATWDAVSGAASRVFNSPAVQGAGRQLYEDHRAAFQVAPDIRSSARLAHEAIAEQSAPGRAAMAQAGVPAPLQAVIGAQTDWLPNMAVDTVADSSTPWGVLSNYDAPLAPALHAAGPVVGSAAAHLAGVLPPHLIDAATALYRQRGGGGSVARMAQALKDSGHTFGPMKTAAQRREANALVTELMQEADAAAHSQLVPESPFAKRSLRLVPKAAESPTQQAVDDAAEAARTAMERPRIRAYHGSPHDFDKFALSKIGTGEGAQAYGHGLYFAENEKVARGYRDNLAQPTVEIMGQPQTVPNWTGDLAPQPRLIRRLADKRANVPSLSDPELVAAVRRDLITELDRLPAWAGDIDRNRLHSQLDILQAAEERGVKTTPGGKMYEVNLNVDPTHLLDWDKALLPQQREQLAGLLPRGRVGVPAGGLDMSGGGRIYPNHHGQVADKPYPYILMTGDATFGISEQDVQRMLGESQTGQQAYTRLTAALGSQPAASAALQKAGIPGIRYLDRGSRATTGGELIDVSQTPAGWHSKIRVTRPGVAWQDATPDTAFTTSPPFAGEAEARAWADEKIHGGTRNYSIFDDSLVDILRKYAILPPLAAGAAASQLAGDDEEGAPAAPRHWLGASFLPGS